MKTGTKRLIALCFLGFLIVLIKQNVYSGDPFGFWLESIVKYPYDVFYNPLFVAVHSQNLSKVKKLLQSGQDPNQEDRFRYTPLMYAVSDGNVAIIKLLLQYKADPNLGYRTPLKIAVGSGRPNVIDLLLRHGARMIPLSEALGSTRKVPVIEQLVKEGAPLDVSLSDYSVAYFPFLVQLLLEKGGDPNEKHGAPLHNAVIAHQKQSIAFLLAAGADPNVPDKYGKTPLYFVDNADYAQTLIGHGANQFVTDENGQSLLHKYARNGNLALVELLLKKGLDVNQRDKFGNTPLHTVALGNSRVIKFLLENGADPSIKNDAGMTAHEIASRSRFWKNVFTIEHSSKRAREALSN